MKLLFDFFPILLFFLAYKWAGIYIATGVAVVAAIVQTGYFWYKNRRFELMHLLSLGVICVLGGATLIWQNEMFIKWKPTAINYLLAVVFLLSHFIGEKPLIERLLGKNVNLPVTVWQRLNLSWCIFFAIIGSANLYVIYHFGTDFWVNFKLFGMLGLTILFIIIQAIYLMPHVEHPQNEDLSNGK